MKNAYVNMLYGDNLYFIGTLVFIISLLKTKPKYDLVLLHTNDVPKNKLKILEQYYTKIIQIEYISLEKIKRKRFVDVYTKLQIFKLTEYDKILFMDNDMIVQKNIDHLFDYSTPAGMAVSETLEYKDKEKVFAKNVVFNAGLWLLKPSIETFDNMIKDLDTFNTSYELEQEYVSYYYSGKWTNISYLYNYQFSLASIKQTPIRSNIYKKVKLTDVYVIHYSSPTKPWEFINNVNAHNNLRYAQYTNYYKEWLNLFTNIYIYYTRKGVYLLEKPKFAEINKNLNREIKNIFNTDYNNFKVVDTDVFKLLPNVKFNKHYSFYVIPNVVMLMTKLLQTKPIDINETYDNIFRKILTKTFNIYIVGGAVRDLFLKKTPIDIDISFDTSYEDMIELCKNNNWPCPNLVKDGFPYIRFGNTPGLTLEGFFTLSKIFTNPIQYDYTLNTLLYDVKNSFVIELTRYGIEDVINKKIRIPVPRSKYTIWAINDWKKPLRYFKMLMKGFTPIDKETEEFIINYIENNFDNIYMVKHIQNIPRIKTYLIRAITGGEINKDGSYSYGKLKNNLLPYLKVMSEHINPDIMIKIVRLLL